MRRSLSTPRAATAFVVLVAAVVAGACESPAEPTGAAPRWLASPDPSLSVADAPSPAEAASLPATASPPAPSEPAVTETAAFHGNGGKICGDMPGAPGYKLVVTGAVSCSDATKALMAVLQDSTGAGPGSGPIQVNGWTCVFSRIPHATSATADGFSCWHGTDTAQLLTPDDPQVGGKGRR
jgi:hypothetical protein